MDFLPSVGASQPAASPPSSRRRRLPASDLLLSRTSSLLPGLGSVRSPPSLLLLSSPHRRSRAELRLKFPLLSALRDLFVEATGTERRRPASQVESQRRTECEDGHRRDDEEFPVLTYEVFQWMKSAVEKRSSPFRTDRR